uniref:Uncharacterized protein n=1 Tax=Romanomermis culicivorax TaxID=13658 RepID=A0A915JHA7_ROMCU
MADEQSTIGTNKVNKLKICKVNMVLTTSLGSIPECSRIQRKIRNEGKICLYFLSEYQDFYLSKTAGKTISGLIMAKYRMELTATSERVFANIPFNARGLSQAAAAQMPSVSSVKRTLQRVCQRVGVL